MDDATDDKVDYLNSPDLGSIGGSTIEGFKAPIIERPSSGIVKNIAKPSPIAVSEDNTAALSSIRAALAAKTSSTPFHVNQENFDATVRMMEDNEEAEERQRQPVIVKESSISTALKLTSRIVSSVLRK